MPELGGHLEAADAAAAAAYREALEVLIVVGQSLLARDGPDRIPLLDGRTLREASLELLHQVRPDDRREVVAGGRREEPRRAQHEVVLEPRVAARNPFADGAEGVVLRVSPELLSQE